ncbi:hypothetical protein FH972_011822 [Carpinus fangiana]|uniref:Uncharacterized protein n=1 Tax=Carpinus fangiana TaxID=176857 RepID=A0A660KSJ3_9ROSI|nr:hypothetical protein FH972_011822 [Carpinus fangiana]
MTCRAVAVTHAGLVLKTDTQTGKPQGVSIRTSGSGDDSNNNGHNNVHALPRQSEAEDDIVNLVDLGLPLSNALGLLLVPLVGSSDEFGFGDIHVRTVDTLLRAKSSDVRISHLSSGILEGVEDLAVVEVED